VDAQDRTGPELPIAVEEREFDEAVVAALEPRDLEVIEEDSEEHGA
jgi:hypothetical protein